MDTEVTEVEVADPPAPPRFCIVCGGEVVLATHDESDTTHADEVLWVHVEDGQDHSAVPEWTGARQ